MFSLDDETLEAGGESILASKGDLGQLLFSASAGLADLSRRLVDVRAEAEGFYKYRARSGELADLKARLTTLKEERERIDTLASKYAQLVETRDRAASQYDEAIRARGEIQTRLEEIQRLLTALPRLATWRALQERLAPLPDLPNAPLGWSEQLPKLQAEEIELATRAKGIEDEVARLSSEIAAIAVDETAVRLADRVTRLADLRARHMTADKDLPERRLQLREAKLTISGILRRIERNDEPDPARLVLSVTALGALRDLIETRSGIETALLSASRELSEAQLRLEEAEKRLKEATDKADVDQEWAEKIPALAAIVGAIRSDDHAARRRLAIRSRAKHNETLADCIRELRPWTGDVQQLAGLVIPQTSSIDRWKSDLSIAQKKFDQHNGEVERLTTEQIGLKAELGAIDHVAGVVSDHEAGKVRAAREAAWASHRRTLDAASADSFETALRHDDLVTNARLGHAGDLAKLHQTIHALAVVEAELGRAQQLRDSARATLRGTLDEIAAAVQAMSPSLPNDIALSQFESWLARRVKTLEVRALVLGAERDLSDAEADAQAARERLTNALAAVGVRYDANTSFETLLGVAQATIDRESVLKALREAIEDRRRELKARERARKTASAADRAWSAA
jgi:uncharacterized protein YhaN